MSTRTLVPLLATAALLLLWAGQARAFGLQEVSARALALAQAPFRAPVERLPKELRELGYDEYREIRFKPEDALWRKEKLPFELMFFHAGRQYGEPVRIHEVSGDTVKPIAFDPSQFDYGRTKIAPEALRDAGFAGFRAHYALNKPNYKDEVIVFLGASYFRAIGKNQHYGLSARGLAVDTAGAKGEEFPRFTEYWIERPTAKATRLTIYALMDSRRVTGAYKMEVVPGADTVVNVESVVYTREAVDKIGIAPLTSMFHFGENQPGQDDYRPEVHDSDGLSVHTGDDEWIWRPLVNPQRLLVTSFTTTNPKGFGLMQRDRSFASYEDPEAQYDRRPSAWVEPRGEWGAGRVELVQIPTPDETNDNIVAYWVPGQPLEPGKPLAMNYRIRFQAEKDERPPTAWVVQTRRGRGYVRQPDGQLKFVVDFDGPALKKLGVDAPIKADVSVDNNAELVESNLFKNDATGFWRMTVRLKRNDANRPVEMRAVLRDDKKDVSETWSYIVPAQGAKP